MDFVGFDRDLSIRKEIDRHLRQRSVNMRMVMEFDNIETIKQAVEIGAGVSILPEPTVRDEVRSGSLAAIRLIAPELHRPMGIIHRQRKAFTPTAVKFVELLQQTKIIEAEDANARHGSPGLLSGRRAGRSTCCPAPGWSRRRPRRASCWMLPAAARHLRQVPAAGRLGRRRTDGRRARPALGRRTSRPAGGWRAKRPCAARRRSRFRPARCPRRNIKILIHAGDARQTIWPPVRRRSAGCGNDCKGLSAVPPGGNATSTLTPSRAACEDDLPDVLRLERALDVHFPAMDLSLLREIPARLREADFRGTAVLLTSPLGLRAGQHRGRRLRRGARHRHHDPGRRTVGPGHGQPTGPSMRG